MTAVTAVTAVTAGRWCDGEGCPGDIATCCYVLNLKQATHEEGWGLGPNRPELGVGRDGGGCALCGGR